VLSTNHSDPVRQTSNHSASEQVAAKSNSAEGKIWPFILWSGGVTVHETKM